MSPTKPIKSNRINIILGITGSVASIKLAELISELNSRLNANICVIPTKSALHFVNLIEPNIINHQKLKSLKERNDFIKETSKMISIIDVNLEPTVLVLKDEDEWLSWEKRGDPVLHIELKKWAHLLLIAPLGANTLAKLSNGICDNLLTCVARAWDLEQMDEFPIIICPAMNTFMYKHPLTGMQLKLLVEDFRFKMVNCVEKKLMCGDSGIGAMAPVCAIVDAVCLAVQNKY